jgi:hypothetical protein
MKFGGCLGTKQMITIPQKEDFVIADKRSIRTPYFARINSYERPFWY